MAGGTLLLLCLPGFFLALFNAEPEVLAAGVPALRMIALSFPFAGVSIVLCAVLQAVGESLRSLAVSLARQILLVLPAALARGCWPLSACGCAPPVASCSPAGWPCCSTADLPAEAIPSLVTVNRM